MAIVETYKIKKLANGWYNFEDVPQEGSYIVIKNSMCADNEDAIKTAIKWLRVRGQRIQIAQNKDGRTSKNALQKAYNEHKFLFEVVEVSQ